jgi:hypothetical protein
MLSAQADELRELAGDGSVEFVSGPIRASVLRDAADTILELRDDLQRANGAVRDAEHDESMAWDRVRKANAENARLRSELESVGTAAYLYGRSDLKAENAKLREIARELHSEYRYLHVRFHRIYVHHEERMRAIEQRMRELGVEVDG